MCVQTFCNYTRQYFKWARPWSQCSEHSKTYNHLFSLGAQLQVVLLPVRSWPPLSLFHGYYITQMQPLESSLGLIYGCWEKKLPFCLGCNPICLPGRKSLHAEWEQTKKTERDRAWLIIIRSSLKQAYLKFNYLCLSTSFFIVVTLSWTSVTCSQKILNIYYNFTSKNLN